MSSYSLKNLIAKNSFLKKRYLHLTLSKEKIFELIQYFFFKKIFKKFFLNNKVTLKFGKKIFWVY